jgi:hypothetical protein
MPARKPPSLVWGSSRGREQRKLAAILAADVVATPA